MAGVSDVRVLDNSSVYALLINLPKEETIELRHIVEKTRRFLYWRRAPFTLDSVIGTKITVEPTPGPDGNKDPVHGVIVLCDGMGNLNGILSCEEVTGYRTSMNVMVPFSWRKHVDNIVIFGSGLQALWHTRLIMTLRGSEVKTITYVRPRKKGVHQLIATVSEENRTQWKVTCSFHFIDTTASDSQQKLESRLSDVDCIFCTTPSKKPLFPASYLAKRSNRRPFISAVGSWQPDMIELCPPLLELAISDKAGYNPLTGETKGVIIVE